MKFHNYQITQVDWRAMVGDEIPCSCTALEESKYFRC